MKATLEFDLTNPDEVNDHLLAANATNLAYIINQTREMFRREIRYNEALTKEQIELLSKLQDEFIGNLSELPINFDEVYY